MHRESYIPCNIVSCAVQEDVYDATSESENNEVQSDRGDTASNQFPPDTPTTPGYQPLHAEVDGASPLEPPVPPQQQQVEELQVEEKHPEGAVWQNYNGGSDQEQHTSEGGKREGREGGREERGEGGKREGREGGREERGEGGREGRERGGKREGREGGREERGEGRERGGREGGKREGREGGREEKGEGRERGGREGGKREERERGKGGSKERGGREGEHVVE